MCEICQIVFDYIARWVTDYPIIACIILICLIACLYSFLKFIFRTDFLGILACLGQTLPLAIALSFKDFIAENWNNYVIFIIIFDIVIFLIIAIPIYIYITRGPTPPEKRAIIIIGIAGLFTWILLFFQTFPDLRFWEQLPSQQFTSPPPPPPPSAPIGRP